MESTLLIGKKCSTEKTLSSSQDQQNILSFGKIFILNTIGAVGNTPLIKLNNASEMTGCNIMVKAEMLNPGGSVKDRAAYYLIREAEKRGEVQPGGTIVEGSFYLFTDIEL